ncbi:glycosyltransferase family 2 protein [Patescibacteria group bacterium]|nr:glycosyltransferase family 2 protein [Patescibacteria group bacterium]
MSEPLVKLKQIKRLFPRFSDIPGLNKMSDYRKYRILEIIPGAAVWLTFILAITLSVFKPIWAIYFIIVFDFYWLVRVIYMITYTITGFSNLRRSLKKDWYAKLQTRDNWQKIYHLVVLPTYKEEFIVIQDSFSALVKVQYPLDKLIVVLAGEERDQENFLQIANQIKKEFGHRFFQFIITVHPQDLSGELPGKGSNTNWAGKKAKLVIDQLNIPYQDILVSSFDVDTKVHAQYFSYLTNKFLSVPDPLHASYQPLAMFMNNIWESHAMMRVVSNGTTFWLMSEQMRPDRLLTFSSHSMPFQMLVDVDFWQNDIVTEDSRIFLQGLIRYDGRYRVVPMHIPVSMDTVMADNFWLSLKNLYRQQRRWAYGVENFPYMAWFFRHNNKIAFRTKIKYIWNQLEGVYSWATAPILIFILGRLPFFFVGRESSSSVIVQNAPVVLERLMQVAMVGLLLMAVLNTLMIPSRPHHKSKITLLFMVIQWVLFPITMIVFGSIPATEAQTRLMFGRYLGFHVTAKKR